MACRPIDGQCGSASFHVGHEPIVELKLPRRQGQPCKGFLEHRVCWASSRGPLASGQGLQVVQLVYSASGAALKACK
jgi:hypothetical protein